MLLKNAIQNAIAATKEPKTPTLSPTEGLFIKTLRIKVMIPPKKIAGIQHPPFFLSSEGVSFIFLILSNSSFEIEIITVLCDSSLVLSNSSFAFANSSFALCNSSLTLSNSASVLSNSSFMAKFVYDSGSKLIKSTETQAKAFCKKDKKAIGIINLT